MRLGQKPFTFCAAAALAGSAFFTGFANEVQAGPVGTPVTVTEITDWQTTPNEVVNVSLPSLNYTGGVYAGINTLQVQNGSAITDMNGFCIDPFHWSQSGPLSYDIVSMTQGPKPPAMLNQYTANEISDLWADFYSPTMTSQNAAGLQIAIWELVSSNAVATDGLPANQAFSLTNPGNDFGASQDLAALATYDGPGANLEILSGPGQDFVVSGTPPPIPAVPDAGQTWLLFGGVFVGMMSVRPILLKRACQTKERVPVGIGSNRAN